MPHSQAKVQTYCCGLTLSPSVQANKDNKGKKTCSLTCRHPEMQNANLALAFKSPKGMRAHIDTPVQVLKLVSRHRDSLSKS